MNKAFRLRYYLVGIAVITILSLLLPTFIYGYLGYFSRYEADDFCTAGVLREKGFWPAQAHWYQSWTGRFSFTFLVTLSEIFGISLTPFLPILLIALWLATTTWAFYLLGKHLRWQFPLLLALVFASAFIFLVLFSIPNAPQILFWQTGSLTYLVPIIGLIMLVSLALFYSLRTENQRKKPVNAFIIMAYGVLAFVNAGFSETSTALQISIFIIAILCSQWLISNKRMRRSLQTLLAFGLGATVTSFLVMVLAPGNFFRQQSYPNHPDIFTLIQDTIFATTKYVYYWLAEHSGFLLLTLIISSLPALLSHDKKEEPQHISEKRFFQLLAVILITMFLLIASCFAPAFWAMSQPPYDRVLVLQASIMVAALAAISYLSSLLFVQAVPLNRNRAFQLWISLLILLSLATGPIYRARLNYFQITVFQQYSQKWDERNRQIQSAYAAGTRKIEVPFLAENLAGLEHIQGDSSHWINNCAEWYYGMDEIIGY